MSKAVLMSIQPYWVFLIIANKMGWNIGKEKTIEVRKKYPKDENWNKITKIYCTKDKKSFAKIPKEYQPLMKRILGKVIGEFVCDWVKGSPSWRLKGRTGFCAKRTEWEEMLPQMACLSIEEIEKYAGSENRIVYGWHISALVIYDKPKELSEYIKPCIYGEESDVSCFLCEKSGYRPDMHIDCFNKVTRPPQSWCYVEELRG